jgi:hypothetical protein
MFACLWWDGEIRLGLGAWGLGLGAWGPGACDSAGRGAGGDEATRGESAGLAQCGRRRLSYLSALPHWGALVTAVVVRKSISGPQFFAGCYQRARRHECSAAEESPPAGHNVHSSVVDWLAGQKACLRGSVRHARDIFFVTRSEDEPMAAPPSPAQVTSPLCPSCVPSRGKQQSAVPIVRAEQGQAICCAHRARRAGASNLLLST